MNNPFRERNFLCKHMKKPIKIENEKYLAFVRRLPCCSCGNDGPCDPHHLSTRSNDLSCVPLCRTCHQIYHRCGSPSTFESKMLVDLRMCLVTCLQAFINGDDNAF